MDQSATHTGRVILFGASGTIGQAVARELVASGYGVTCVLRRQPPAGMLDGCTIRIADVTDQASIRPAAFAGQRYDAVVSCLASRSGAPEDAWVVDYRANKAVLDAARASGVPHMVLLSAICVQRPKLAFQFAKLAFEKELRESGLTWTIVRPTAFFKSLSGQIARVAAGKPFLLFGDGRQTRCKPISDRDLARYIVGCIANPDRHDRILPIGGPGPAITPLEQGAMLFELTGQPPRHRHVPIAMFGAAAAMIGVFGKVSRWAAEKAEYARIARYYASESMLVLDHSTGEYCADSTPETGNDTLYDHYRQVLGGARSRGDAGQADGANK